MTRIICDKCKRPVKGKAQKLTSLLFPCIYFNVTAGAMDICDGCATKLALHIREFFDA